MTAIKTSDLSLNLLRWDGSKGSTPPMQHTLNRSGGHEKVVQGQLWHEKTAKHPRVWDTQLLTIACLLLQWRI